MGIKAIFERLTGLDKAREEAVNAAKEAEVYFKKFLLATDFFSFIISTIVR